MDTVNVTRTYTLLKLYDDILSLGDPRVKNWFMMDNPFPTIGLIVVYLLLVLKILPDYMKNKKPFDISTIIRFYNIFQVAACAIIIHRILNSGWIQGEYNMGCAPVDYSNNLNAVRLLEAFHWTYFLKGIELIETMFFALRKKSNQISGLHVYHHGSTFFLAWIGCKFIGGGMVSVPIVVNSSVHIIMYTYYYLSSLGLEWQKRLQPYKSHITMCQMIQFAFLLLHAVSALHKDCKVLKQVLLMYVSHVILVFNMFYNFYTDSYKPIKKPVNGVDSNVKIHT